jgi:hypothetical protein
LNTVLFVFGTLLDSVTRARVLGRPLRAFETVPALLEGCERVQARGRHYPVLIRDPGGIVDGLFLPRLTARERARLKVYEGREYRLARIRLRAMHRGEPLVWTNVFMARGLGATKRPWVPMGHRSR